MLFLQISSVSPKLSQLFRVFCISVDIHDHFVNFTAINSAAWYFVEAVDKSDENWPCKGLDSLTRG